MAFPPMNEAGRRTCLLASTWACIAAGVVMLIVLSQRVERTPDELNYQLAGRALAAREPLDTVEQRFQGPLILLGTQLGDGSAPVRSDGALRQARLGMLVFPALLLVVLAMWSRAALGERAGLIAAFLAATNPTILAYGPLLSSDIAFTATALLAGWLAWRWLQAPGARSLLLLGGALGATAATKYTGLIACAAMAVVVLVAVLTGFDPWPSRSGRARGLLARSLGASIAVAVAGGVALFVVYAAYLFTAPPFPPSAASTFASASLRALAALPGGATLLGLLPEPMVRGIDHQAIWANTTETGTFLDQRGNHHAYYPVTVLFKTPLVVLGAAALGVFGCRRYSASRGLWLCALVPPFALLLYCSVTRSLQMGIRYVLPVVPALLMLASAFLCHPWARRRLQRAVFAVVVAASLWNAATGWPHFIGFFNSLAGGSQGGYRVVADGNCDWQQLREPGQTVLQQRHPDIGFLRWGQGPRFGRVAAYAYDLKIGDARDPTATYHWLTRFEPFDHVVAAWLAFDVTPAAFERAIAAGDERAAEDLALAWLAAGEFDRARRALDLVATSAPVHPQAPTRSLVELVAAAGDDPGKRDAAAEQLAAAGHYEIAATLVDRTKRANAVRVFWLLMRTDRQREAIHFLEAAGADGSRTTEEVVLLAASVVDGGRQYVSDPMHALELLQRGPAPAPESQWHGVWQALEARVQAAIERERNLARIR